MKAAARKTAEEKMIPTTREPIGTFRRAIACRPDDHAGICAANADVIIPEPIWAERTYGGAPESEPYTFRKIVGTRERPIVRERTCIGGSVFERPATKADLREAGLLD